MCYRAVRGCVCGEKCLGIWKLSFEKLVLGRNFEDQGEFVHVVVQNFKELYIWLASYDRNISLACNRMVKA